MKSFSLLCTAKQRNIPSIDPKNFEENDTMKERIRQVMEREEMSQKEFSAAIGISQASLSSILNGRTMPTNRHVEAIHRRFPEINTNWMMFGEGEMLGTSQNVGTTPTGASETTDMDGESVRPEETTNIHSDVSQSYNSEPTFPEGIQQSQAIVSEIVKYLDNHMDKPRRRVREIQIIYDDDILETFVLKTDK